MAYRKNPFQLVLQSDPSRATEQLHTLFQVLRTRRRVAEALGVNEATLARWLNRLERAGRCPPRAPRGRPRKLAA